MKILFIAPPWAEIYGNYRYAAKRAVQYPPLGLCYLASAVKKASHIPAIIDTEAQGLRIEELIDVIKSINPDIVGVTAVSPLWDLARFISDNIKKITNIPTIIGGPHITVVKEEALKESTFDYGVYGEGEETIVELLEALNKNESFQRIKGLIYKENGRIVVNPPRPLCEINALSHPDRGLLKIDKYLWSVPRKGISRFTTIITTRGCPFKCIFCSQDRMFGKDVRYRNPEDTVNEIEEVVERYRVFHFIFIDDNLVLDIKRMISMCKIIKKRKLKITWEGWTRADSVDDELIKEMSSAGLVRLSFGIESGNDTILKSIGKGTNLETIRSAYRSAKKYKIETRGSVIFGFPGETRKTVKETLRFVRGLKECDQAYFNIAMPYPGTKLREMALKGEGGIRLLTTKYSALRRHGNVVMEVNDLDTKYLLQFQRKALLKFYLTPRRIFYNFFRAGIWAGMSNTIAFLNSIRGKNNGIQE